MRRTLKRVYSELLDVAPNLDGHEHRLLMEAIGRIRALLRTVGRKAL